jgi:hypothetical protein
MRNENFYGKPVKGIFWVMTHKPEKAAIAKHLIELRREGIQALNRFNRIAGRLNFYERYLTLSKCYDVRLAGPFLVIKGGKPKDRTGEGRI